MPVYHERLNVPKARGELYGPIDGVRPQDHLITYNYLRYLRCCCTYENIYEQIGTRGIKYCHTCYLDLEAIYSMNFVPLAQHTLVHERNAYYGQVCLRCKRLIMKVKPAFECNDCIEEYLNSHNMQLWERGQRIQVIKRWIED